MTENERREFNDSLERCRRRPDFIDHFYDLFLASSEEVAAKFAGVDLRRQARVLLMSLYNLMLAADGRPAGMAHLRDLATSHDRHHRAIRPELYELWRACLLQAVRDCDPKATAEVEDAWRAMLSLGISVMQGAY